MIHEEDASLFLEPASDPASIMAKMLAEGSLTVTQVFLNFPEMRFEYVLRPHHQSAYEIAPQGPGCVLRKAFVISSGGDELNR
ncbi:MAG: hypothetical protein A2314_02705 [Elusimicrobia bacterium RIFOXYB2_FULL_50_12]|nr:MAG: hypothetical protein A2314_02705 [Elusimicrobia bacterium RIFOXYB2_FULL_50_12]